MLFESTKILQKFLDEFDAIPSWDTLRTARTESILTIILEHIDGDILEIGAHQGTTTKVFCEVGKRYGCDVFVIDPWDGRQQGNAKTYQTFQDNTSEYHNLNVQRIGSENPLALKTLLKADVKFAFILIDGLHSYDAVRNDLNQYKKLLTTGGVICIDDWRGPYGFSAEIQRAVADHLDENYQELPTPNTFIESYFVKLR